MASKGNLLLQLIVSAKDEATSILGRIGGALAGLTRAAIGLVFPDFGDSVKAAENLEIQMGKLRAGIESTGGTAGLTAEQIDEMARRLDEATLGSAEGFRNAAIELLTFKSVGVDSFERTLKAAQDLADAGFGTVESATVQLGKALEDPLTGLTALTRVGVSFTAGQKAMIENFIKLGDVASAQNVILAAVEGQVKGVASAAGGGLAGAVDLVGKRMTDLKETVGGVLTPVLTQLNLVWADVIGGMQKAATEISGPLAEGAEHAGTALKALGEGIGAFLVNTIRDLGKWLTGLDWQSVQSDAIATKDRIAELGAAFKELGSGAGSVVNGLTIAYNALSAGFRTIASSLLELAGSAVATLGNIERAASKIGLGSLERANELRQTALNMQGAAVDIINQVETDGREMSAAYDRLTGATDSAAKSQKELKDSLPVVELQTLTKTLDDYRGIADKANQAAEQARKDFDAGKISAAEYGQKITAAAEAQKELAKATQAAAETAKANAQAAILNKEALNDQFVNLQKTVDASTELADANAALRQSALNLIRAEIDLARAKGDTAEVTRLQTILADKEVQQAQEVAREKQKEADSIREQLINRLKYRASLQESNAELEREIQLLIARTLAAQGEAAAAQKQAEIKKVTKETTQETTQTTQENTQATNENTQATNEDSTATEENNEKKADATDITKVLNDAIAYGAQLTRELSAATENLYKQKLWTAIQKEALAFSTDLQSYLYKLRQVPEAYADIGQKMAEMAAASKEAARDILLAPNGVARLFGTINKALADSKLAFYEQQLAAEKLTDQYEKVAETGKTGFQDVGAALKKLTYDSEQTIGSFNLLDDQDLSRLRAAIDAANDKLREMQEETQSARDSLAEMNAELLEAQGLDAKAELLRQQLDYQQQLADIEAQRQEAELSGNRELITILNEQRKVLEQINRTKVANIEADAAEQAQSRSNTTTPTNTGNVTPINRAGGGKTYNLNLVGVRGQTLSATTDTDPTAFLDALEAAQRSAQ